MNDKPYLLILTEDSALGSLEFDCFDDFTVVFSGQKEVLAKCRRFEPALILYDLDTLSAQETIALDLTLMQKLLSLMPWAKVIAISANNPGLAASALTQGAYDYFTKPLDVIALAQVAKRVSGQRQYLQMHQNKVQLGQEEIAGISTASHEMAQLLQMVQKVAANNITVLLQGESGSGKEVIARALHAQSQRADGPFVAINCAAIPENLLESELFGYEKGAYTGAVKTTPGKIESANHGTLFLDEIADMPLSLQPKLLRFLQERTVERLGARQANAVDVRVICATHQELPLRIEQQQFREDLYYRLCEMTLRIPPLRARGVDVVLIARQLLEKYSRSFNKPLKRFSNDALVAMNHYSWPGNVRELENRLKRAVVMADGPQITQSDLDLPIDETAAHLPFNLKVVRDNAEREAIVRVMIYCEGNVTRAADLLGVSRPTLYNILERLQIADRIPC